MTAWKDGDPPFASGPRCRDVTACRSRVEAAGERWMVREKVRA